MSDLLPRTPARQRAETIRNLATSLWTQMQHAHHNGMAQLWDPSDCTPAEVLAELGTEAAQIFELSAALRTLITEIDPSAEILDPPLPFTVHPDGTVTLDPEPEPQE